MRSGVTIDEEAAPAAEQGPPVGLVPWHQDFPGHPERPHLSPRQPGRTYDRTRRQALESIVAKLSGACTREAWLFARDVCARLSAEDLPVLVEALDRALQTRDGSDWAENILGALAGCRVPAAADAILRALESPREAIRNAAMEALVSSGTPDSVRTAGALLDRVGARGMKAWVDAARRFLPSDEIVASYRRLLADARLQNIHSPVADAALLLPIEQALAVFEPFGDDVPFLIRPKLVALHQAAGSEEAEVALRGMLRDADPAVRRQAVAVLPLARVDDLLPDLLPCSADPEPGVRLGVVAVLAKLQGEDADLTLDLLATDPSADVRRAALAALVKRGRRGVLDDLVQTVRTGTGSQMTLAIQDLVAARDPAVIPALNARMETAPQSERTELLRAIALTTAAEAFPPLRDAFLRNDELARADWSLVALLMANCRGAEPQLLEFFRGLPQADYVRRALLLSTLANVAVDRNTPEVRAPIFAELRRVAGERGEIPQLRLLALEFLRRDLGLEDQVRLRAMARAEGGAMGGVINDLLFELF